MKIHVNAAPEGYRVVVDGKPGKQTSVLASAHEQALATARFGTYCIVEWRKRTGALWSLVAMYEPKGGGRVAVRNPYDET